MRRAAKRDANEPELIESAEAIGAWWVPLGPLDGWCAHRGVWTPVEIKNPKGKNRLTDAQKSFLAYCAVNQAPVWTWRTVDDVLSCLAIPHPMSPPLGPPPKVMYGGKPFQSV